MKKIIAFVISVTMLACFTGCSEKKAAETNVVIDEIITTVETSSGLDIETVFESESETVSEISSEVESEVLVEKEGITDALAVKDNTMWAIELSHKIDSWENNVNLSIHFSPEYGSMIMNMHKLGDKFSMITEIPDISLTKMIYDGEKIYLVDDASKSYCVDTTGTYANETDAYLVSDDAADCYLGDGIEEIDGISYIYEEYDIEGQIIKYYFDESGEVKCASSSVDDMKVYFDFIVDFTEQTDESIFMPAADYKEVTMEEYSEMLYNQLMSSVE